MRGFFDPIHHGGLKKIQPNPHESGWVGLNPRVGLIYLFIIVIIKLGRKKYIAPATWVDKQNIHELVFKLSYKQNISNRVDKQNIHELISQLSYKQMGVECGSGKWQREK